ncbi:putative cysteine desulfurase [Camellia lanceoleosa]|uniref:Cysteine desulfurase n=1 Tax=Camellia lanceoleosa TaxID=1840588 RepID=A0ACC0F756_9ERIC|nr:putative cysteine desulfurase [Camellia lanceoleosa]
MELKQPMIKEMEPQHGQKGFLVKGATKIGCHVLEDTNCRLDSLRMLETGVPNGSPEKKLAWLRSQVIGSDLEFETPFGKRRLTYADYTASGRSLLYIENYIIANVLPVYGNTHTSDSYVGHQTTKMVHEASKYVKSCLGGKEEDALLFVGSGTTAAIKRLQEVMGISVPSISRDKILSSMEAETEDEDEEIMKLRNKIRSRVNEERWVVFVGPYEHHSNLLSWRQSLAQVVEIGLDETGLIDMKALKLQLENYRHTNRPMLGSFSACSNVTGIYSDTRALATLLHRYGAFACFDFAASGPYVEIDMRSGDIDGYDAIFLSPHKFAGGPSTPGILLMSKVLYQLGTCPPSTCGGGTVSFVNGFNEKRALDRLLSNPNIWVLGNTSVERQAILSFLVFSTSNYSRNDNTRVDGGGGIYMWREAGNMRDKPLHGPFVAKLFNDLFGIQARGGCACAGPYGHHLLHVDQPHSLAFKAAIQKGYNGVKPGWTRINLAYFIAIEEFEFILAALEFIAMYGQRFLPLYDFNWKTGVWTIKKKSVKEIAAIKQSKPAFSNSLITHALQAAAANFEDFDEKKSNKVGSNIDPKTVELIDKYVSYLETAKKIAHSLPKFPPPRKVPKDIDLNLVHFRV